MPSPKFTAGLLLAWLALRYAIVWSSQRPPVAGVFGALALGGCLWWVANRQFGAGGSAIALAIYVSSPIVLLGRTQTLGALGLFGMLYTGVGVAHAMQGPRRKWLPRICLMAALTAFTAAVEPVACAAGLLLALAATCYLAEGRRRLLPLLFGAWIAAAALAWLVSEKALHLPELLDSGPLPLSMRRHAGLGAAFLLALTIWAGARRSRYFGNSSPLVAALLLAAMARFVGDQAYLWALPFALLFTAGCLADALESRWRHEWAFAFGLLAAWQLAASL